MIIKFFLARHGQTQWNVLKRLQGRLDSPMTEQGLTQAKQLATSVASNNIELIISSPLPRAKTTAQICQKQLNLPLYFNEQLIERDFGSWQGQLFDSLTEQAHFKDVFFKVNQHAPPQGETGLQCAQRFEQALQQIANNYRQQHILVVTHGDMLRCFCHQFNQADFVDAYSQYGNGALFIVNYDTKKQHFSIAT